MAIIPALAAASAAVEVSSHTKLTFADAVELRLDYFTMIDLDALKTLRAPFKKPLRCSIGLRWLEGSSAFLFCAMLSRQALLLHHLRGGPLLSSVQIPE
jgi:hypothetical protein